MRHNAWQFRQILGRGAHGILLCQAETADAVRAFVESCRYPHHAAGVDPALPTPLERMHGAIRPRTAAPTPPAKRSASARAAAARRPTAAAVWGISAEEYMERCEPWPLNPRGELLLGVKLESPEGVANCEEILAVPGLGFAEIGPGDLSLSLGYRTMPRRPYPAGDAGGARPHLRGLPPQRRRLSGGRTPENITAQIDEGVRVIAGHSEAAAKRGRAHQGREMKV